MMRCANDLDNKGFARQITAEENKRSWGDLLPFSKRKNQSDEVELGEDDFELVELAEPPRLGAASASLSIFGHRSGEAGAPSAPSSLNPRNADRAETVPRAPRARTMLPVSRRILDEEVEEDVAGECLASIAAETSRDGGDPYSSSHIRAALPRPQPSAALSLPRAVAPSTGAASAGPSSSSSTAGTSRLPSVSAPPFLRTTTIPFRGYNDAPGVRDSSPPPAFVRRSSPLLVAAVPAAAPSSYVAVVAAAAADGNGNAGSVAPVAMPTTQRNEPTVIVVRERPRAAWMFAAAALGALGAVGATRFLAPPAEAREVPALVAAATQLPPVLPAAPSTAVVAPPSAAVVAPSSTALVPPAASAASGPAPAIVHFGDDQGVAIKSAAPRRPTVPSPAAAAAPAPVAAAPATVRSTGPRAPSMGPALPDGSFGLGRSDTPTTASVTSPAPLTVSAAFTAAPESPHKRALTPEQQLAAAQLKASMK